MKMSKNGHKSLYFVSDSLLSPEEIANFTGRVSAMVSWGPYLRNYQVTRGLFGHPGDVICYPTARVKDGKVNFAYGSTSDPYVSDWRMLELSELEKVAIQHNLKAETR
ncbi:hypothetical protein HYX04_03195 [Candidatus Woesearchaeota archaeon]|nr:hypothetical protein [Candidatus Woesearchaeota archaeon]